jgi:transcriptional regulator with GAF, ATPase, and Fis domain
MDPLELAKKIAGRVKGGELAALCGQLVEALKEEEAFQEIDLGRLLDRALGTFVRLTGAERGFIALRRQDRVDVRAARNIRPEALSEASFRTTRAFLDRVLRDGRPVREGTKDVNPIAVLALPLKAEGAIVGAVVLENATTSSPFTGEAEEEGAAYARRAAPAIRRAMIVEEARDTLPPAPLRAIVGHAPGFRRAIDVLERAAPSDAPVLLTGESGTGKELFARALHELSPRRARPFVAINCAAVPESLLESELFGHVKGAFTGATANRPGKFEVADGGTLFLDELSEMSPALQAKLLRALQNGEIQPVGAAQTRRVNTRVVCATNRRLEELVAQGRFREDLYYRLNVVVIRLPPLRERREDLPVLIRHFLVVDSREQARSVIGFDRAAMERLLRHDWPGNVRELHNAVRHAVLMAQGPVVGVAELPESLRPAGPAEPVFEVPRSARELRHAKDRARREVEKAFVIDALKRAHGNVTEAARQTGVHRTRFAQLIRRYDIRLAEFRR